MIEIRDVAFDEHDAVELRDDGVRMVIVHSIGPRIAWFGRHDNLLFWDAAHEHGDGEWRLYGGHRLWVTRPGADESGEIHAPDNSPCRIERTAHGVRVTAPPTPLGIERTMQVSVSAGTWTVTHMLCNVSSLLWSGGAWALTCTLPRADTVYRVPLGGGPPAWDVTTLVIPHRWGGTHTSRLDDPQITLTADALEVRPDRDEAKRMMLAPQGTIEMTDDRGLFRKVTSYDQNATYPLGTNLAIYVGPRRFMVEMESMSALRTIFPGEVLQHIEVWTLH